MAEVRMVEDSNSKQTEAKSPETREPYERPTLEMFRPMSNVAFTTNVTVTLTNITGP
jgi:hypothetical protein